MDVAGDHFHGNTVIASFGDDDVSVSFAWLDKFEMHGAYCVQILTDDGFEGASTFFHVPS